MMLFAFLILFPQICFITLIETLIETNDPLAMKINFFLKDAKKVRTSIEAIIRYKGNRFKLGTGVSCDVGYWDKGLHRARKVREYPEHVSINISLEKFEIAAKKFFTKCDINGTIATLEEVKAGCGPERVARVEAEVQNIGFLNYFVRYYENGDYKEETRKHFKSTANFISGFEKKYRRVLRFENVDIDFYTDFKRYMMTLPKPRRKDQKKEEADEYYSLNYFGAQIKHIKTVMREAGPEGAKLHANTDYAHRKFVKDAEEADTVYLSIEELKLIHDMPLNYEFLHGHYEDLTPTLIELKRKALSYARSIFLIGCYTALRISDFSRLERFNFSDRYIRIKPKKGIKKNEDVVIPIHPVIAEIMRGGFDLSKKVSDQKVNEHLKELCRLAGINELVTVVRTEGGKHVSRTVPKWQLVSSHTGRRSGATNMFKAGIPAISIMKITGHRTEKSFLKYIKISQEENAELLAGHAFFK